MTNKTSFYNGSAITSNQTNAIQSSVDNAKASEDAAAVSEANAASSASTASTKAAEAVTSASASETSNAASEVARLAAVAAQAAIQGDLALTNADVVLTNADVVLAEADKVQTGLDRAAVAADLVLTNQDTIDTAADLALTNADVVLTNADVVLAEADKVQTGLDRAAVAADLVLTNQDTIDTAADVVLTNADVVLTHADVVLTNADVATATTRASEAASSVLLATLRASQASVSAANAATSASTATTKASEASSSASAAATSASTATASKDAALAALDSFDDRYLGQKSANVTVDNDGDALVAGSLYFNTTTDSMMVYEGSSWVAAYASLSGALIAASNLSDLANAAAARTNLGLAIGTNVQAYSAVLAATTASYTTALNNKLNAIEASATADQTDAEIRAAVEAASDSNVFTDADHTKLNAIEASADVTDTANVIAALTAGSNVQIAANGTISATDTNTTYSVGDGGLTQVNFTTADNSKLDGIEASATADQTAAQLLTAIKTVDGTGSGLDADLLDGVQGASYLRSDADDTYAGNLATNGMTLKNDSNAPRNFKMQPTSTSTDVGISLYNGDGSHSTQLYGTATVYGFLDGNWASWDIQKTKSGQFKVDEGSGLQRVFNDGYHPNADALTTGRNINGVFFNGTANITVPAVDSTKLPLAGGTVTGITNFNQEVRINNGDSAATATHFNYSDNGSNYIRGTLLSVDCDATFTGGAGAISVAANSDIRFTTGTWTGEYSGKIQYHSNSFYIQSAGSFHVRNSGGTNVMVVDASGNMTITGTVDGRDVAADGTKLDTIATSANNYSLPASPSVTNLNVATSIIHTGDTNTAINFATDQISIAVGGSSEVYVNTTGVRLGDSGNGYFQPVSGDYGSIQIDGGAHGGWEGYSIGGRMAFMHDNGNTAGIFNDVDNEWFFYGLRNSYTAMYYNGSAKIVTTNTGASITGDLNSTSDIRYKKNIETIDGALDKVKALKGVTFEWDNDAFKEDESTKKPNFTRRATGVIAQDVEKVLPEAVCENEDGMKNVAYGNMVGLLIEAIKEQQVQIDGLKAQLNG